MSKQIELLSDKIGTIEKRYEEFYGGNHCKNCQKMNLKNFKIQNLVKELNELILEEPGL